MESKLTAIISSAEFQTFLDEVIAREVKEFVKKDSHQQFQHTPANQRQRNAPQQTNDMLNESLKVKMNEKIGQLLAQFAIKNLTPIKPLIEISSEPAAGMTIRTTTEATSATIKNQESQAEVPAKDERNLVFPLLSKTYFPVLLFTTSYSYFSLMWRSDGPSLRNNNIIWMEFCF